MNVKCIMGLNNSQLGILADALSNGDDSFVVQINIQLDGKIKYEKMKNSFNQVVNSYDALKSSYLYNELEKPVRVVYEEILPMTSISRVSYSNLILEVQKDREKGFSIEKEPLIRMNIFEYEENSTSKTNILITFHHLLMDGWCKDIFLTNLFSMYFDKDVHMDDIDVEYYETVQKVDIENSRLFWLNYLSDVPNKVLSVPYEKYFPSREKGFDTYIFETNILQDLSNFSREKGYSKYAVLSSVWSLILQQTNNLFDIVLGVTTSGRKPLVKGINESIGMYTNTIPLRVRTLADQSFERVLKNISETLSEIQQHDMISLREISEISKMDSIFNHIILFEDCDAEKWKGVLGKKYLSEETIEHTSYPLTVTFQILNNKLFLKYIYDKSRFDDFGLKKNSELFVRVFKQLIENYLTSIEDMELIENKNIEEINISHETEEGLMNSLNFIFEKYPDNIAIKDHEGNLSYRDLDILSDNAALKIADLGIKNEPIALYLDRGKATIINILGVLKSNNYYVPIDYDSPRERIEYILDDIMPSLIIANDKENEMIEIAASRNILFHSTLNNKMYLARNKAELLNRSETEKLAYVMYTSGSTGKPKGVKVYRQSIPRLCLNTDYININRNDKILQLSNYAFDGSIFDIFGSLLNGACIISISKKQIDNIDILLNTIVSEKISICFITTALFNALVDYNIETLSFLKIILFGGEKASLPHVNKFFGKGYSTKLIHVYGPTEGTVFSTYFEVTDIYDNELPIGKPIKGTKISVMNDLGIELPKEITGEIYISGIGLAKGYTNSELTKKSFINFEGIRFYKTGDIGFFNEENNLVFKKRIDDQIKYRGYRIELDEIYVGFNKIAGIDQIFINPIIENQTIQNIEAFFTSNQKIKISSLKKMLAKYIPHYMIPQNIYQVSEFPLTTNGKVDKNELKKKSVSEIYYSDSEKSNEQQLLINALKKILNVQSISLSTSFYQLGGDSIKAIQVAAILKKEGYTLPIRELISADCLGDLSLENYVTRHINTKEDSIPNKYSNLKDLF
ncbi:AMP-binding protein [Listeria monocytogenes]|nr:AMP-binding protein [Listeria monocytogenes]